MPQKTLQALKNKHFRCNQNEYAQKIVTIFTKIGYMHKNKNKFNNWRCQPRVKTQRCHLKKTDDIQFTS